VRAEREPRRASFARVPAVAVGVVLAVASTSSFAMTGFIASRLVETTPGIVVAFYEALFGLVLVATVNARFIAAGRGVSRSALPWIGIGGLALGAGTAFFYTALGHIPFSVAAPVIGAVPLVSYGFILLLLRGRERLTPRVLLGATMVVTGVIVIRIVNA